MLQSFDPISGTWKPFVIDPVAAKQGAKGGIVIFNPYTETPDTQKMTMEEYVDYAQSQGFLNKWSQIIKWGAIILGAFAIYKLVAR